MGSRKVVYVLTSRGWDRYARMVWISALLAKRADPSLHVALIVETVIESSLRQAANSLIQVADEIISVRTHHARPLESSRFIKTTIRQHISGDFIFIDADTLPLGSLEEVFSIKASFAAALEHNTTRAESFFPKKHVRLYEELGWRVPAVYFNSGVMLFRDEPEVHAFSSCWHSGWLQTMKKGVVVDQPSLNYAVDATGLNVGILPWRYNTMVVMSPWKFRDAIIAHFFASTSHSGGTLLDYLLSFPDVTEEFVFDQVDTAIAAGHPWGPNAEAWQLWRSGNYVKAFLSKLAKLTGKHSGQQDD